MKRFGFKERYTPWIVFVSSNNKRVAVQRIQRVLEGRNCSRTQGFIAEHIVEVPQLSVTRTVVYKNKR